MSDKNYKEILTKAWLKILLIFGASFFLLFTASTLVLSYKIQSNNMKNVTSHFLTTIKPYLQVNDEYSIRQQIVSFSQREQIYAIELDFEKEKTIKAFKTGFEAELKPLLDSNKSSFNIEFLWSNFWKYEDSIEIFKGDPINIKIIHGSNDLPQLLLLSFVLSSLLIFILLLLIISHSQKIITRLTTPLIALTKFIGKNELDKKPDSTILQVKETKFAYEEFLAKSRELETKRNEEQKHLGMAKMAQMLAHDVRKPFSLVLNLLNTLDSSNADEIKAVSKQSIPEIEKTINSVNDMIADVMEVGSKTNIHPEPISLGDLIKDAFKENFKINPSANISIAYDLNHSHKILADKFKLVRVLSNLVSNSIQAQKDERRIWINSNETSDFIKLTIGNLGKHISKEDLPKIFEAFYTKDKRHGTGLGLAIVKKVITDHGGEISCISDSKSGTEFHLTLPISSELDSFSEELPNSNSSNPIPPEGIENRTKSYNEPFLIVVDDSELVLHSWSKLNIDAKILTFTSPEMFWSEIKENPSLIEKSLAIVTDNFFDEKSEITGLEFAEELRNQNYSKKIYLSSDGEFSASELKKSDLIQISKVPKVAIREISI